MVKITPDFLQKFEFFSIFLNNLFVFLGVWLLGWSLFDSMFLVWLELLAAMLVVNYLVLVVPIRYGRPGTRYLEEYRKPAFRVILLSIYTLLLHYLALVFLIELGGVSSWDTSQGILMTLVQLPVELWRAGLLLLAALFLVTYLLPPFLLERRGVIPSYRRLPMSTRVMIHRSQFVVQYLWFVLLWVFSRFAGWENPLLLIGAVMLLKSVYEGVLFFIIKRKEVIL
jgi:hypothetical protein